jgi:preprotein translocase subunit SecF
MINILGKRYLYFAISLLIIIPGMVVLAIWGMPLSIDFKGGSLLEVSFASGNVPSTEQVNTLYADYGINDPQIVSSGQGALSIRSSVLNETTSTAIVAEMGKRFNDTVTVRQLDSVGPTVGQEVAGRAVQAVAIAAVAVVLFITFSFRGVSHSFRYGVCAIIAMLHDILIVISIAAIGGKFFGWQIDSLFLTAFLTVIGFSVQDKIVVFDRIRENSSIYRKLEFEKLANHSIIQTLQRSINTQLMTSEFFLLALALFGGVTLREFAVILLVGLLSGTYSSIFIAAPLLVVWENKEWQTWFHKKSVSQA